MKPVIYVSMALGWLLAGVFAYRLLTQPAALPAIEPAPMTDQELADVAHRFLVSIYPDDHALTVTFNGVEIARSEGGAGIELALDGGRGWPITSDMLPKLSARTLYPCGWRDVDVAVSLPAEAAARDALERGAAIPVRANPQRADRRPLDQSVNLRIDNTGNQAAVLAIGQHTFVVEADDVKLVYDTVVEHDCPQGRQLKIGGVHVADFPAIRPTAAASTFAEYLIDPTGQRCYGERKVVYGPLGESLKDNPRDFPGASYRRFEPSTLHRLDLAPFDYVFQQPPATITVTRNVGEAIPESTTVSILERCDIDPGAPAVMEDPSVRATELERRPNDRAPH